MTALLRVEDLRTYFYTRDNVVKAVDGVSFSLEPGQTLGVVGESGSGKSVTMLSVLGLVQQPPGKIVGGKVVFQGEDLLRLNREELRQIRGRKIAMIFQDPMTSLNPYLSIETQLCEGLLEHTRLSHREAKRKAIAMLERVGITSASQRIAQYPHQFSGGMRQRVMVAMAMLTEPDLIIADEPTTALDVTIQAQILELLRDVQRQSRTSLVLITHDLGVVAGMCEEVLVLYAGRVVEKGSVDDIFYRTHHPYTQGLLRSVPSLQLVGAPLQAIPGLPPDPAYLPPGCAFSPRCPHAMASCRKEGRLPVVKLSERHESHCYLEASGAPQTR